MTPPTSRAPRRERMAVLLRTAPIIPVLTIDQAESAVLLARALVAGGLRLLEVTLRTPAASMAAAAIAAHVPEAVLGIGTVASPQDLARARDLGAQFALSPGATPQLLDAAMASDLPFIPGIATASELMAALARGFDTVKFFRPCQRAVSPPWLPSPARSRRRASARQGASARPTRRIGSPCRSSLR